MKSWLTFLSIQALVLSELTVSSIGLGAASFNFTQLLNVTMSSVDPKLGSELTNLYENYIIQGVAEGPSVKRPR
jgi:hypothetical protein